MVALDNALEAAGAATADIPPIPTRSHRRHRDELNPPTSTTASSSAAAAATTTAKRSLKNQHLHLEPVDTLLSQGAAHHSSSSSSSRRQPHPHSRSSNAARTAPASPTNPAVPAAADHEIISNLITSLASHDPPPVTVSLPASPGSFGVDYGAFSQPANLHDLQSHISLDDLAASPPIVRTSKPPSGFSPLTAATKSPRSPSAPNGAHRSPSRDSSGLRSFIRSASTASSRPSSTGSWHDDAQSIGNLSVERGSAPTPELRRQRSRDSWGKKTGGGRVPKGLMYMSSKERLREKDQERRRASAGPSTANSTDAISAPNAAKMDNFLAETPIREEQLFSDSAAIDKPTDGTLHHIPVRDSSLRHLRGGSSLNRSSTRRSKQRDADSQIVDSIPEGEEPIRHRDSRKKKHSHVPSDPLVSSFLLEDGASVHTNDDSAPFPSVSQGPRREEPKRSSSDHIRPKRSSSRMKRLSGPVNPRIDEDGPKPDAANAAAANTPAGYERPGSADSIDDAVESYLCSPRLSQKIRHPQTGRVISFSEVGDSEGSAVFCCVGMGLTRYITAFYDELALTLKLRLITPDRPGVGDSEPYTDGTATPLSWPDDVYAICQALKITKFSVLAHSAGAIYALATALRMPQHIRGRIHLLAPWIPPSQMNVFGASQASPPTNAIPTSQRILRALPTPILKAANSSFMSATSSSITSSLPKNPRRTRRKTTGTTTRPTPPTQDKENQMPPPVKTDDMPMEAPSATENMDRMVSPRSTLNGDSSMLAAANSAIEKERQVTYDMRLTHAIWELATTGANPAVDLLVCLERRHTIGFRYVDITRPVTIHHGSRDTRVPVDNVKWLGKTMRRCEVRVLEGEGHGLMASATVMGSVLMEISKEWEDWIRVTDAEGRKDRERGRRPGR
ncbi:hypothetical protein B0I35DRAFT_453028 [Stachybotrys elegans]|uniref:AB hydrolase-1 domain-containing protein n=1 Tax=Stachybotrys elegans TaxID=80388 RepID=A0A8K0SKE0_9HYPO|nr:hypothetical protein B0I35DRAFT_453028 [Stachybotrys elegans]